MSIVTIWAVGWIVGCVASSQFELVREPDGGGRAPVYSLGRFAFAFDRADVANDRGLAAVFLPTSGRPACVDRIDSRATVRSVIDLALGRHADCLWIHGSSLVSARGRLVLLAGGAGVGKTTTALALSLAHGWKVFADDATLIDDAHAVVGFAAPFSLKPGTLELLDACCGRWPRRVVVEEEFIPVGGMHAGESRAAEFDLAVYLDGPGSARRLASHEFAAAEFVRLLLRSANAMHQPGGADRLMGYLGAARCHRVMGGSLSERVGFVLEAEAAT